ncbi:MAG: 50S ribosomal protein L11 methyltransferase [Lachnospiraceae bacterium]|nr:50S ribosomal protein L11 methyltransferase [Lachnospiraceae bacterium]
MKFNKYTIKTTTEAEDIISSSLMDLGIEGVEIEDRVPLTEQEKAAMFVDILPQGEDDNGIAYLNFYLNADEDNTGLLEEVRQELEDIKGYMDAGDCTIECTELEDTDYINNWKQYFHQFYVDDILIIPSWEEVSPEDEDKMIIHIDPGTAFGTGMHETTQLCIRQLRKYVNKDTVLLDVGTGSGILSIMAYKFGASCAVGTDLDPCTIEAVQDNMESNGLSEAGFKLIIGNIIDSKEIQDEVGYDKYDVVTANILADVLIPLTPVILDHIKTGGIYITSGIIEDKEQEVTEAVKEAGFEVLEVNHQGEWVSITARKS